MALNQLRKVVVAIIGIGVMAAMALGEGDSSGISARIMGKGAFEFGQIVDGQYSKTANGSGLLSHYALEQAVVQVGGELNGNNGLSVILLGQGTLSFPYTLPSDGQTAGGFSSYSPRNSWNINQAYADYSLGDQESPFLNITAGYFPFKYNPDARDFGDYLFRINPYPQFLQTTFDMPYSQLLGLRVGTTLFSSLRADVLLTSETVLWPLRDFSPSAVVSYKIMNFGELGAGVMWDRLLSVDNSLTNPPTAPSDLTGISFQGTKVEFRGALNIKQLLPCKDIFGENDLRLYAELCLNGLKNYTVDKTNQYYPAYNNIEKRMPLLLGFNVPAFKFLEVLSIEAEWWDNSYQRDGNTYYYANSYYNVLNAGNAVIANPVKYGSAHFAQPYGGEWHWSVYAKKALLPHLNLVAQVARDHSFIETMFTGNSNADPEEALDGLGDWMWLGKLEYVF